MDAPYNYGISQEDVRTEVGALALDSGDSLLCVASGGETPLNIAALLSVSIVAVDVSLNQLRLCRLKQVAATGLEPLTAAAFLGFRPMPGGEREALFQRRLAASLPEEDRLFWEHNLCALRSGPVVAGRFERYMKRVSGLARLVVGRKNLQRLFDCGTTEEQLAVFDRRIGGLPLRVMFALVFHPFVYRKRGIDPAGLTHTGARNIGRFFYQRFRSFCCSTPARRNFYLQQTFYNRVLFPEALPEYLQPAHRETLVGNADRIQYRLGSIVDVLQHSAAGQYNKIHLSNIGDWISSAAMADLFHLLRDKTRPGAKVVVRYIHRYHRVPASVPELVADPDLGEQLMRTDRYPFYSVIPLVRI